MKVLLIQPNPVNIITNILPDYVAKGGGDYPPLGLMYIASSLKKKINATVEILDADLLKLTLDDLKKEIVKRKPAIAGITATSFTIIDAINTARIVKNVDPEIHVCLGGPHASIYPSETVKLSNVDSVVVGEGEETFTELVKRIRKNEDLEGISGLIYKSKDNQIINNGNRQFIQNLDSIPFPARHLVDYKKYKSIIGEKFTSTTMMSSRGCPYNCIYCYHFFGKKYRAHSISYMLNEIKNCLSLGIKEFWYFDDNFIINRQRTLDFCNALISHNIDILWHIRTRIDLIDKVLGEKLLKAGCKRISFGIESASYKILKIIKKEIDLDEARRKIFLLKSIGFEIYLDFMIGSPGETREDINRTILFAIELDPDYVQFAITTPYPQTDLYALGKKMGVFKSDYWRGFASSPNREFLPQLLNENLSRVKLQQLLNFAYRKFYFRPKYILRRLFTVKSIVDLLQKAKAAFRMFVKINF